MAFLVQVIHGFEGIPEWNGAVRRMKIEHSDLDGSQCVQGNLEQRLQFLRRVQASAERMNLRIHMCAMEIELTHGLR